MKFFALVFLSVLAVGLAAPSENELTASEEQFVEEFVKNYGAEAKRYLKATLHEAAEAICENKQTDFEKPMEQVIERALEVDSDTETVCAVLRNHLHSVLEPMINAVDGCLPNEEAGAADFVVRAVVSAIGYVCDSTGEQLLEIANPCLDDIDLEENKCIENVEQKWNEIVSDKSNVKDIVCKEYVDARPCLESAVTAHCKLEITRNAVLGLLDSVLKTPCNA